MSPTHWQCSDLIVAKIFVVTVWVRKISWKFLLESYGTILTTVLLKNAIPWDWNHGHRRVSSSSAYAPNQASKRAAKCNPLQWSWRVQGSSSGKEGAGRRQQQVPRHPPSAQGTQRRRPSTSLPASLQTGWTGRPTASAPKSSAWPGRTRRAPCCLAHGQYAGPCKATAGPGALSSRGGVAVGGMGNAALVRSPGNEFLDQQQGRVRHFCWIGEAGDAPRPPRVCRRGKKIQSTSNRSFKGGQWTQQQ